MDIMDAIVKHKMFGKGQVVDFQGRYITVKFSDGIQRKFVYPDSFSSFLVADDLIIQKAIEKELNEQEAKIAEEIKKIEQNRIKEDEVQPQFSEDKNKRNSIDTQIRNINNKKGEKEEDNKPSIYLVFQGDTFTKECNGGYIWAPVINAAGNRQHHWERMLYVRKGDIILHGCDGKIAAISIAKGSCYDCIQPPELVVENLWDKAGRKVDCNYTVIRNPIATKNYKDKILEYKSSKYYPFNRDGEGNQGYLYDLNRELAKLFIEETIKANPEISSVSYIADFLSKI